MAPAFFFYLTTVNREIGDTPVSCEEKSAKSPFEAGPSPPTGNYFPGNNYQIIHSYFIFSNSCTIWL